MSKKFSVGEKHIVERNVGISVFEMNGVEIEEVIDYPKGEVFEILEELGDGEYRIEFWTDSDTLVNDKKVTYVFDGDTLASFLMTQEEYDEIFFN